MYLSIKKNNTIKKDFSKRISSILHIVPKNNQDWNSKYEFFIKVTFVNLMGFYPQYSSYHGMIHNDFMLCWQEPILPMIVFELASEYTSYITWSSDSRKHILTLDWNAMPLVQVWTYHSISWYSHRANLLLCYLWKLYCRPKLPI